MAQLVAYSLWERGVVSSSLAAPTRVFLSNLLPSKTSKNLRALSYDDALFYYTMYFGAANFKIHSIILLNIKKHYRKTMLFLLSIFPKFIVNYDYAIKTIYTIYNF